MKLDFKKEIVIVNIILIAFIVFLLISELVSGKFELNDFKVYYLAMKNFAVNQPIYGIPFGLGSGYYKYAPIALLPFTIFFYVPYFFASLLYYSIVGFCFSKISKEIVRSDNKYNLAIFITLVTSLAHLHRELHLGNVNMILLLLYSYSYYLISIGKKIFPGILIGIGLLFKLHFIVLIPILLIFRKFKISLISISTFLLLLIIIFPIKGLQQSLFIYSEWINIMKFHNSYILNHPDTIYINVVKFFNLFNFSVPDFIVFSIVFITISVLFFHFVIKRGKVLSKNIDSTTFALSYFFAIAMIPSLTLTDTEHFLFALPIIYLGSTFIFKKTVALPYKLLFIIGLLFYGGNIHDLWGHKLSVFFSNSGFLGLGNIIVVILTFIQSYKVIKNKESHNFSQNYKEV